MSAPATADLWWKNAVIYCLDVQTFADSNGDGMGDFGGLTAHVDDLAGLGVTCIWLMPFYPTVDRDDGYDVTDYYAIDPRLGTFGDFTEFMAVARDRGMRVIADLVVNHTSDQHHWFQEARRSRESKFRDFYVWQDEIPEDGPEGVVFEGEQTGVWTFDHEAGQYYLHRFYHHQPDLNVANEEVRDEIAKVMGFWLAQGLSGFRVDAVPFLIEVAGIEQPMEIEPHTILRNLRAFLQRRRGDGILLGEVNLPFEQQRQFFGDEDGDELHMLFDFIGMQAIYLAMARSDAGPIATALKQRPDVPPDGAYASFLRNHDELTLDKLSDSERQEVFEAFGRIPTCSSTIVGSAAGCHRCSAATTSGCGWRTASCSRCPVHRRCSTARRSVWARTWRSTVASRCAHRCSGRRPRPPGSPRRPPMRCGGRSRVASTDPNTSTSRRSGPIPSRCSTGSSG
jgi:trehalose synthase